jgi:hypothetical protein
MGAPTGSTGCGQQGQPTCFGGKATLLATYSGPAAPTPVPLSLDFNICGTNPRFSILDQAESAKATGYWFFRNQSIHETNESQFCETGRSQAGGCASSTLRKNRWPAFGAPAGYGINQIDPVDNSTDGSPPVERWSWQANISGLVNRLNTDPFFTSAYSFWQSQVQQWNQWNANHTPVAMAVDPPTNDLTTYRNLPSTFDKLKSPNCTFTMSLANDGTTTNTGQPNPAWFGDAILMKKLGGGKAYLQWDNPTLGPNLNKPRWLFTKGNSVSPNIVYEFCTCTANDLNDTSQGCVRSLK